MVSVPVPPEAARLVRAEGLVNMGKSPLAVFRGGGRDEIDVQASTFVNGQVYALLVLALWVGVLKTVPAVKEGRHVPLLSALGWSDDPSPIALSIWLLATTVAAALVPWRIVRSLFERYSGRLFSDASRRSLAEAGGFDIARYAPFVAFAVAFAVAWLTYTRLPGTADAPAREPWLFSAFGIALTAAVAWLAGRTVFRARFSEQTGFGVMLDLQLEALKQDDVSVRVSAVEFFGRRPDARSIDALVGALRDPELQVRWAAAKALRRLGDARARAALEEAARDEQLVVRLEATKALRTLDRTARRKRGTPRRVSTGRRWRTVYVFISSTFDDMHAERDYLVKDVLPRLRDWCERRRLRLIDIDLRWGVTEQDTLGKNVVEVCLRRIDECRPFFLCFLGQRRGWVPRRDDVAADTLVDFPELDHYLGRTSVTELEVLHALLSPLGGGRRQATDGVIREPAKYSFFYLRDPSYLAELPPAPAVLKQIYTRGWFASADGASDEHADAEELRRWREEVLPASGRPVRSYRARWDPQARSPEMALPLQSPSLEPSAVDRWRRQWQAAGVPAVGLDLTEAPADAARAEAFNREISRGRLVALEVDGEPLGDVVLADLQRAIEERYPEHAETEAADELEEELEQQEHFLAANADGFVERPGDFDEIDAYVEGDSDHAFVLTGPGGSGKSMLLARWIDQRRRSEAAEGGDEAVYFRFIAAGERSTSVDTLLRSLFLEMRAAGDLDEEVPETPAELRSTLFELFDAAGRRGRTIIALDGLDQFESGFQDLAWIPTPLPFNVKLLVSFKRGTDEAERFYDYCRGNPYVDVVETRPFDEPDRARLVNAYLSQYLKELEPEHVETLIASEGADNPLYLKIVLSELRVFGVAARLHERIRRDFGSDPAAAFEGVLRRLEDDPPYAELDPRHVVPLIFALLAHSRSGLTEDELADLIALHYPWRDREPGARRDRSRVAVNFYLRQARPYLARRQGRHVFFYDSFRAAVRNRYTARGATAEARSHDSWHMLLGGYFERQPLYRDRDGHEPNARKTSELPWQQIHGRQFEGLESTLCNLDFIEAKCRGGGTYDLVQDYALAREAGRAGDGDGRARAVLGRVRIYERFVTAHAHVFARDARQVLPFAHNHASGGPVVEDAVAALESRDWRQHPWVLLRDRPPLLLNPALVRVLEGHRGAVTSVALSADGTRAVSGSADGTLRVWDLAQGASLRTISAHADGVNDVAITPDGALVASGGIDENVRVWGAESGVLRASFWRYRQPGAVNAVALAADGSRVVSGGDDGKLKVWNVAEAELEAVLEGHFGPITCVDLTPDGQVAVSGGWDCSLRRWDVERGLMVSEIAAHSVSVQGVAVDTKGALVASSAGNPAGPTGTAPRGLPDSDVRVWSADGELLFVGSEHEVADRGGRIVGVLGSTVYDVALTPDARVAVSGAYDRTVCVWDVEHLSEGDVRGAFLAPPVFRRRFTGHSDSVLSVAVDGSGTIAASGGFDRTIRVWNLDGETAPPMPSARRIAAVGKGARVRVDEKVALMLRNRTIQLAVVIPLLALALAAAAGGLLALFGVGPIFGSWIATGAAAAGFFALVIWWLRWRWMLVSDIYVWRARGLPRLIGAVIGLVLLPAAPMLTVVDCPVCGRRVCGRKRLFRCGSCGWRDSGGLLQERINRWFQRRLETRVRRWSE
jgi:WD40 repeat protein